MTEQQIVRSDISESSPGPDEVWRDEIQAKVARYRTRRGRRIEGTYSMRFPFVAPEEESARPAEADASAETELAIGSPELEWSGAPQHEVDEVVQDRQQAAVGLAVRDEEIVTVETTPESSNEVEEQRDRNEFLSGVATEPEAEYSDLVLEGDPEPLPPPVPRPQAKRKVIAFPRQATTQEEIYRLADPVIPEQPRILDVPEELEPFPTTPLLEGLQLPADQRTAAPSRDHIELPYQAASIGRRLGAGLVDCALVAAASGVFGAIAYKLLPKIEPTKPLVLTAAILPVMLWAAYEYLLVMYGGTTAGMQVTKVRLSTFKGEAPNWRHRRRWVMGLYFSTASLGMGLLWSLVDVDRLCWHDRISHTYLTKRE
jgi:uncharacterized RDD family membrane protein YckC